MSSSSNVIRVNHVALSRRYVLTEATHVDPDGTVKYEGHRYTTGSWSYVGIQSEQEAVATANAIAAYLKRTFYWWKEDSTGRLERFAVVLMPDEVAAVHDEGPLWRVDVQINEDDKTFVDSVSSDIAVTGDWPTTSDYTPEGSST